MTVTRKQKDGTTVEVICPTVIDTYNNNMGGIDRGDQFWRYYELRMKSWKVYKCGFFWFLVEICLLNNFIFCKEGKRYSHYKDFRVELAKQFLRNYNGRKWWQRPVCILPAPSTRKPNLNHYLKKSPKTWKVWYIARQSGTWKGTQWFCTVATCDCVTLVWKKLIVSRCTICMQDCTKGAKHNLH